MQLLHFPQRRHHGEDVLNAHLEVSRGAPFCANPACALHVRLVDERVAGGGNWVVLPDGTHLRARPLRWRAAVRCLRHAPRAGAAAHGGAHQLKAPDSR